MNKEKEWVYVFQTEDTILDYWVLGLCPSFGIPKNTTFQKPDLFPSSAEEVADTLLGPSERAKFSHSPNHRNLISSCGYLFAA
jgi:hypothetical protein